MRFDDAEPAGSRGVADPYCSGQDTNIDLSGPFDCLKDIKIGKTVRTARYAPPNHSLNGTVPALLFDAALRVGGMHPGGQELLCVPVGIRSLVLSIGSAESGWEIRSTNPLVQEENVVWQRTEAFDTDGKLRMVLDDAVARVMSNG